MKHITVNSIEAAWREVDAIFPTDYAEDERATARAGYKVYRSTRRVNDTDYYNYICDLGTSLEVNLCAENWEGETVLIHIEQPGANEQPEQMHEYILTIGLFDKDTEKQEISREAAARIIETVLINRFDVFAFTMTDCAGVYKMQSTGRIVREPSIRIEIATDRDETAKIHEIITVLKGRACLNQETIMLKHEKSNITFE